MTEEVTEPGHLAADFFTHSYRISGHLELGQRSLYDLLNDHTTSFLRLSDAYVSPIHQPGDIIASHTTSFISKPNLTLVVVPLRNDALSRKHTYGSYLGTYLSKVTLTVPSFEVEGYLRLSTKMDLRRVLTSGTDDFIPVLDGRVRASVRRDVVFSGGGILVNKQHIGVFSVERT
jgi:hypothetical protein